MPKSSSIAQMLEEMVGGPSVRTATDPSFPLPEAQEDELQAFLKLSDRSRFKVGDKVVLNHHGKGRYRFPMDKQVAMISEIFTEPKLDNEGNVCHGEVIMVCGHVADDHANGIHAYLYDFRYIDLAPAA